MLSTSDSVGESSSADSVSSKRKRPKLLAASGAFLRGRRRGLGLAVVSLLPDRELSKLPLLQDTCSPAQVLRWYAQANILAKLP